MTIEFHCHQCGRLLRTSDDKAGKQAKCPDCGSAITIPFPELEQGETPGVQDEMEAGFDSEFGFAGAPDSSQTETRICPMCGEEIKAAAIKCRYCGEDLGGSLPETGATGRRIPTKIDAGDVISTSWGIYKKEFGLCLVGFLLPAAINFVAGLPANVLQALMDNRVGGRDAIPVLFLLYFVFLFISIGVQMFMAVGQAILFLNIARGKRTSVGDLFTGGPYFLRMLGNSFLFGLMVFGGMIACIIPGIIVALMFWPYVYILVDLNVRGIEPLKRSTEFTSGNWGAVFVCGLAGFGIQILGLLMLCIGVIFTSALVALFLPVAYCKMAGIPTARV